MYEFIFLIIIAIFDILVTLINTKGNESEFLGIFFGIFTFVISATQINNVELPIQPYFILFIAFIGVITIIMNALKVHI